MSEIQSLYRLHEVIVDENDDFIQEYEKNLPHGKFIVDAMCDRWNTDADDFLLKFLNQECDNKIESCYMHPQRNAGGESVTTIKIRAKKGVRISEKLRNKIFDFIDAQMCDGWGEGFFGMCNIMTAPDGTRFYPD